MRSPSLISGRLRFFARMSPLSQMLPVMVCSHDRTAAAAAGINLHLMEGIVHDPDARGR